MLASLDPSSFQSSADILPKQRDFDKLPFSVEACLAFQESDQPQSCFSLLWLTTKKMSTSLNTPDYTSTLGRLNE